MAPVIFAVRTSEPLPPELIENWLKCVPSARAEQIRRKHPPQRELSLLGEMLARYALNKVFHVNIRHLVFETAADGKPYVKDNPTLHFNISHSGEYAVCAVCDVPVGVDIQKHGVVSFDKIARRYFPPQDWRAYQATQEKQASFYRFWTKREALGKWLGVGLRPLPRDAGDMACVQCFHEIPGYTVCVCWEKPAG